MPIAPTEKEMAAHRWHQDRYDRLATERDTLLAELAALRQHRADGAALWAATLAYGAARLVAIDAMERAYAPDTTPARVEAHAEAEAALSAATTALHAAYRAHAARATGGGRGEGE